MDKEKNISEDRKQYLRKQKIEKILVKVTQFSIVIGLILIWEILANKGIIDSFIMSSPSRIVKTFLNLSQNDLIEHLKVTCLETMIGFLLGTFLGAIIAVLLWWSKFISKVSEPFLVAGMVKPGWAEWRVGIYMENIARFENAADSFRSKINAQYPRLDAKA